MRAISIEEDKSIGLNTLLYFDHFCRQHKMKYFIAYGTLLGAIRHQGFIPWDDDIDVVMLRDDYNKLIELHDEISKNNYYLNCAQHNDQYLIPFAKLSRTDTVLLPSRFITGYLYGASIDIFPLDTIGNFEQEEPAKQAYKAIKKEHLKVINKYHHYTGGHELTVLKKLAKQFVFSMATRRYGLLSKRMEEYGDALVNAFSCSSGSFVTTVTDKAVFRKEWFDECIEVPFEGHMFPAPKQYDQVLRKEYGDYMKIPPKEKRVIPHEFEAYYID